MLFFSVKADVYTPTLKCILLKFTKHDYPGTFWKNVFLVCVTKSSLE